MKPMLAKKWQDQRKKLSFPLWVQPKLNGVRSLYSGGAFQSRDEILWKPGVLLHIQAGLSALPKSYMLDGELYFHGWSLQTINGAISINRLAPSAKTSFIQYWIFDIIDRNRPHLDFGERQALLHPYWDMFSSLALKHVPTHLVHSELEASNFYRHYKEKGFEGLMYRVPGKPYGFVSDCSNKENRWDTLLKRKDFVDEEFTCVDINEGEGKYVGCVGSLVFDNPYGPNFSAGSGLFDAQRIAFMQSPPIGRSFTIRYEMLSDTGVPLKPSIESERE